MNPTAPPDEPDDLGDDDSDIPTIHDGLMLEALRAELDARDISNFRKFLDRAEAESRRAGATEPTRLEALGPFRDLVEIGRGGMGVVFRARDPETGHDVAVKTPLPGLFLSSAARRLFDKEAEAVGRLDHPAIVRHRALESDPDAGLYYIVSDYCDGPDLERWLRAWGRPVSARDAARIARDLAGAVAHAHDQGVLHRDIKPSNVLLPGASKESAPEELSPRLTDFGLAKLMDAGPSPIETATATGVVMGAPPYMAPEQAAGRHALIDRRTDVYGLGAVLYELLTLRPPFRGETPIETLGMVMTHDPAPVRVLRAKVPRALEAIAHQCLEKDRDRRYPTADALRDDLDAFLAGRRVRARRPGFVERLRRWRRRRPKSAALAASALAIGLLLAAGFASWTAALSRGRERSDQYAYVSRVLLAQRALDEGRLARAQPTLHDLIPQAGERDRREFAWYYLWRLCRREVRMIFDPGAGFNHLAMTPDGSMLVHGGDDGARALDLSGGREAWRVSTPGMRLDSNPVFSPDGKRVALLMVDVEEGPGRTRAVEVRNVADGALLGRRSIPLSPHTFMAGLPEDGRLILLSHTPTAEGAPAWVLKRCSDRGDLPEVAPPRWFRWHAQNARDGLRSLVIDGAGRFELYDARRDQFTPLRDAATMDIRHSNFSEDGRRVAVARRDVPEIVIFDATDGRPLHRVAGIGPTVSQIALQPGGEAIVVRTADQEVRFIDPARKVDVRIFEPSQGPGVESRDLMFSRDGRVFFAHRTEFLGADHIEIRSSEDGRRLGQTPARHTGLLGPWTTRPGPRPELIYALGLYAWRWDWNRTIAPDPEDSLRAHDDEAWAAVFSPDGSILATCGDNEHDPGTIRLRARDGRLVREWRDDDSTAADLVFAPDGSWIATAHLARERAVRIRPVRGDGAVEAIELPDGEWARALAIDPGRPILYVGGDRGTILAWDVARRREVWRVMPPPELRAPRTHERILGLAISRDGRRLAASNDRGVVRRLDARDGGIQAAYEAGSPLLAVAYSPDGRTIAAGDREGWIHLLDAQTLRPRQVMPGDDRDLRCLAFSPDGRTLAAAGLGRVVRLWDPFTGEELLSLAGHEAQINSVAFSPDGETLVSADHVGVVRFWRAPRGEPR